MRKKLFLKRCFLLIYSCHLNFRLWMTKVWVLNIKMHSYNFPIDEVYLLVYINKSEIFFVDRHFPYTCTHDLLMLHNLWGVLVVQINYLNSHIGLLIVKYIFMRFFQILIEMIERRRLKNRLRILIIGTVLFLPVNYSH